MWIISFLAVGVVSYALSVTFIRNLKFEKDIEELKAKDLLPHNGVQEHKVLKQEGYNIHYFVSGEKGREAIFFLHSAFSDHRMFDQQVAYFSKDYRVITIDLIGHGLSQAGSSGDKIDASAEHILQIMEAEGYEKSHFCGVSLGSLIAQHFAVLYPEKVKSVTVTGGYNLRESNSEIAKEQNAEKLKWILKIIFSMDSFRRYVTAETTIDIKQQARFYESMKSFTRKSFRVMQGIKNIEKSAIGTKRAYPLLILVGDLDRKLVVEYAQKWHTRDSGSVYALINNAGHHANMDNPEAFNDSLHRFLRNNS